MLHKSIGAEVGICLTEFTDSESMEQRHWESTVSVRALPKNPFTY